MLNKSLLTITVLAPLLLSTTAFGQTTNAVDPTCMMKNADGTQSVDKTKCPDGKSVSAAKQLPATKDTANAVKTPDGTNKPAADSASAPSVGATTTVAASQGITGADATASATKMDILVSPDKMTGAKILSANDFIGKTVYSRTNEKVGSVDDLILSENGVQAVVLGVGGFLGMGTKDVAVQLSSIQITKDGDATKLIVDASKDQLKNAPTYDLKARTYTN
ncbi:MAG: PRC-barrel domain-containing protein [Pseudomonadota bacterium]|nr:PRC-barrel domain-containing protein [Pseudomonadota bacterium]